MADHAKKTKSRGKGHLNGVPEAGKDEGPKQVGSSSVIRGNDGSKNGDRRGCNKKEGVALEALIQFRKLQKSWPEDMARLFDPSLSEERRVELWQLMWEGGESLRRRFGWAIPNERALRILQHFAPIVEVGSGLGYWAMILRSRGVDVTAYDKVAGSPPSGDAVVTEGSCGKRDRSGGVKKGTESDSGTKSKSASGQQKRNGPDAQEGEDDGEEASTFWTEVEKGGPEKLEEPCNDERTLFLCYPDDFEDDKHGLGLNCLQAFEGDVVIHVGELFGDSLCMSPGQSPWGRTTSQECQEELVSKFHCILKIPLPRWPHSRDTLTVWKRNEFAVVNYGSSDEDDDDEEEEEGEEQDAENDEDEGADAGDDGDNAKSAASMGSKKERKGASTTPFAKKSKTNENDDIAKGNPREKDCAKTSSKEDGAPEGKKCCKSTRCGARDDAGDEDAGDGEDEVNASDVDSETLEGLMAGEGSAMMDCDLYAFVPAEEQMLCEQAAPFVQFLLKGDRE